MCKEGTPAVLSMIHDLLCSRLPHKNLSIFTFRNVTWLKMFSLRHHCWSHKTFCFVCIEHALLIWSLQIQCMRCKKQTYTTIVSKGMPNISTIAVIYWNPAALSQHGDLVLCGHKSILQRCPTNQWFWYSSVLHPWCILMHFKKSWKMQNNSWHASHRTQS